MSSIQLGINGIISNIEINVNNLSRIKNIVRLGGLSKEQLSKTSQLSVPKLLNFITIGRMCLYKY